MTRRTNADYTVAVADAAADGTDAVDLAVDGDYDNEACPPDRVFAITDNVVTDDIAGGVGEPASRWPSRPWRS